MKKKIFNLLFAGLCCLMIAGCGSVTEEAADDNEDIVEEDGYDDDVPEEEDEPGEHSSDEEYFILPYFGSDMFHIVDGEGDILYEIDKKEIQDSLTDADGDKYIVSGEEGIEADAVCFGEGFLFFDDFIYSDEYDYHPIVFAVGGIDDGNYKIYPLWEGSTEQRVRSVDYYNGSLYIDFILGYDENYDISGYSELAFTYDEKTDSFTCEETHDLDAVFEKAVSVGMSIEGQDRHSGTLTYCYRRTLDDCGYIFAGGEDFLAAVDENGKVLKRIDTGKKLYTFYYDAGNLFYLNSDYTNHLYSIHVTDVRTGKETQIGESIYSTQLTGANLLSNAGDKFYYTTYEYSEFGIRNHRVYMYDATEGTNTFLYEEKTVPGSGIVPGTERFTLAGDYLYYLGFDDGNITWMRRKISDASVPEKTGIILSHIPMFDLGTVSYVSDTYVCPDCGTDLIMEYCEYFILDDEYSGHAAEINDYLEQKALEMSDWEKDYYETSCADHSERPTFCQVTNSFGMDSAFVIDGRYLAVDMSGFWYGGGSAGYYPRAYYLFDLETGESLSINDFYTGTEKEFIELVAKKTVENFLTFDEYSSPYYGSDEDEVYSDARSFVSFGGLIRFTDDGIYYCFLPDEVAVYQVDYVEIFIPYEELLGRETLKP